MPSLTRAPGMVFLVGAGPGDPGLLTVRGRALLDECDAIVYDALAHPDLLERESRDGAAPPELHFVGKRGGDDGSASQDDINALLVRLAREGKRVVRLKGGDPFVFGRGSEEAQALVECDVAFEVVPGVTAGIAAPAYAGVPVTHRGLATSVTFVTGHEDPALPGARTNWRALAQTGGTIVLYMGVKRLPTIAAELMAGGLPGEIPAAAIQWGTHARQRTVTATLATLADRVAAQGITAPVITVIGWTVVLRDEIAWFDQRPLFGLRIVVTRAAAQASVLSARLREQGAHVLEMPATRVEPLDPAPMREAIGQLSTYRMLAFTSQNAVRLFWGQLLVAGRDARALAGIGVCAVGPATAAALLDCGIAVDVVPDRFVAEGVLEALAGGAGVAGSRVLYLCAEGARDVLPAGLREMGATVDVVPIYRSIPDGAGAPALRSALERGAVDLVTVTSASGVHGLVDAVGAEAAMRAPVASIGPVTSSAARDAGLEVAIEAESSTIDGLVAAIVAAAERGALTPRAADMPDDAGRRGGTHDE